MSDALPLVKICEGCELEYRRPTGSQRCTDEKWAARRFCSSACGLTSAGLQSPDNTARPYCTFDSHQLGASMATEALLKRQMAYYNRVARERGLVDVWEAAVVLGMAA